MNWKSDFPCESQRLSWVPYVPSLEFQRLSSFPDGRISQIWIQSETRKPKCQSKNLPITWQQVKVDLFPKNLTILSVLCATPLSVLPGASCAVSIWCEPGGRGFHEFWGGNQISKNRAHPKGLLFFSSLDSKWLGFLGHFLASFPDKKGVKHWRMNLIFEVPLQLKSFWWEFLLHWLLMNLKTLPSVFKAPSGSSNKAASSELSLAALRRLQKTRLLKCPRKLVKG